MDFLACALNEIRSLVDFLQEKRFDLKKLYDQD
jgi:hypothetical protein